MSSAAVRCGFHSLGSITRLLGREGGEDAREYRRNRTRSICSFDNPSGAGRVAEADRDCKAGKLIEEQRLAVDALTASWLLHRRVTGKRFFGSWRGRVDVIARLA
jgi:hypothetical protein